MRIFYVNEENVDRARTKLAGDLGVSSSDLKFLKADRGQCSFEVLFCPPAIDVEISRDAMKAVITRIRLPIGEKAPKLNTDLVVELLKEKGVTAGIKYDAISKEIYRILNTPGYDDAIPLNLVAAEGIPPITGQAGRPQWAIDLKLFQKKDAVFAKKGEIIAKAPNANPGQSGLRVTGDVIKPVVEEQFRLNVGQGIEVRQVEGETQYVTKTFGRLHFDQGVRMRLDAKILEAREGLDAAIEAGPKSFSGQKISAADLLEFAAQNGVVHGVLSAAEIDMQLRGLKGPSGVITLARGDDARDGAPGEVVHLYRQPKSDLALDVDRAKEKIVFPGEDVLIMKAPSLPSDGKTAFGEKLRGRPYTELPLYPGKGVVKEKRGEDTVFKSTTYGRVLVEKDRVSIQNIAQISKSKMEVTLDLFPQNLLNVQDALNLLRELDVLFGYEKDKLEEQLIALFRKGDRVGQFVLARGKLPAGGSDARLQLNFDPEEMKPKGLFKKEAGKSYFAAAGDLLLTKFVLLDAQEGMNVFRERVPVPKTQMPKDIRVGVGKLVSEKEVGKAGDPENPLRIEYRSRILGTLIWKDNTVDIKPTLQIDRDEKEARLQLQAQSDFGTQIDEAMIRRLADEEGIRVELEWDAIRTALRESSIGVKEGLVDVVIARSQEPEHGENAKIQYFVEYNGRPLDQIIGQRRMNSEKPMICDCVRPGDVVAVKTPPGVGKDGKTIFGRRIAADRGMDEQFLFGPGIEKSKDGLQLYVSLPSPGFIFVENGRIVARTTVTIAKDKMSAGISIFPSQNPRFMIREDKLMSMLQAAGINYGIKTMALRDAIEEVVESGKPVLNLLIAEGRAPEKGRDATFRYAFDVGDGVGEMRADGSVDFKNRNIFQSVKQNQLLLIKQQPAQGADGIDVCGNILPGQMGSDVSMNPGPGVFISDNGLEYRASISGIVEVGSNAIRVIPGLFIPSDVGNKTGNITGAAAQIFVKGGVLPDFEISAESDVHVERVAEACRIVTKGNLKIRGGIVGRDRGYYFSGGTIETLYVNAGATVEAEGDVVVRNEVLNSRIVSGGIVLCEEGAGAIVGGEIFSFRGVKAKVLGAAGAETPTVLHLGQHILSLRRADQEARSMGITGQIEKLQADLASLGQELRSIYDTIPEVMKTNLQEGQRLQNDYRILFDRRQERAAQLEALERRRTEILSKVPIFRDFVVTVTDLIHPGTTIIFGDVKWVLKEPMRGVEIRWNLATSNFISKRI